jgi:hypothetical protein
MIIEKITTRLKNPLNVDWLSADYGLASSSRVGTSLYGGFVRSGPGKLGNCHSVDIWSAMLKGWAIYKLF